MPVYDALGYGVYHLDAQYVEPGVASIYAVVEDGEVAFFETGTANSLPFVQQFLDELSIDVRQVRYVVPTHVHLDHAGGAGVMMQTFPDAQLVIHPRGARHMIDPSRLVAASKAVYGEETFNRLYGQIPSIDEGRVIVADHEFRFSLGKREFLVLDTPGHAYHHFCVVDEQSQGIFTGDTFGLSYPNLSYHGDRFIIPTTTPTHFNPQAMHQSIDLLMSYHPQRMYLTHFNMLPDPASHVDQYHDWVDRFVAITEQIKPDAEDGVSKLVSSLGQMLQQGFELDDESIHHQLAMDINLNAQGLAFWYQHRDG